MGTSWSARIVAPPDDIRASIEQVLARVVAQMSHWQPRSDLSRLNAAPPGGWHALPAELSRVLATALQVARESDGAFDPAMGALADLWGFGPSGPRRAPPSCAEVAACLGGRIEHDAALLRARRLGPAQLDFSGIAKGYAVDAVAEHLRARRLRHFLVEIGGELRGEGIKPDGQPWWVEVAGATPPLRVALHGLSIATSGDYVRYFEHEGQRYAHTLDPRTGTPIDNGVVSVTVLRPQCMLADAWATALTVLGADRGMALAEHLHLGVHMRVHLAGATHERISSKLAQMLA